MKIAVFNGSPRKENTAALIDAFCEGAKEAGHEVEVYHVGKMKIAGCLGCGYCHTKGEGNCIQKDDLEKIMPAYKEADMIVFASPIYYFTMTYLRQVIAVGIAWQGVKYIWERTAKAKKAALLLSSGSPGVYEGACAQFKEYLRYTGIEGAGVITANGAENKSEAKLNEVKEFAKSL